ncbi:MAG: alginate export family protein [Myxococcales bacterium]|nr:alginate export family protein [Myxococcales bacterium]
MSFRHALLSSLFLIAALSFASPLSAQADVPDNAIQLGELRLTPRVDVRLRSELRDDLSLDAATDEERWRLLMRTGIGMRLSFRAFEALVDLTDGRELVHEATSADAPLDFTQAYLGLRRPLGLPLSVKLGRQAMNLGSRRLISTSSWSNRPRAWDALRFDTDFQRLQLTALVGSEVKVYRDDFDRSDFGETLWGFFSSMEISPRSHVELYVFGLYRTADLDPGNPIRGEDGAKGDEHRITPGFRAWGDIESPALDWEFELALQFGQKASDTIHAAALHGALGWRMPLSNAPRLGVEVNYASGDPDAEDGLAQTFVPLYGTTHEPYGIADLFRWQNMIEVSPSLSLQLHPAVSARLEHHTYWLAETGDDWVNTSGKVLRPALASGSSHAGQEVSAIITWTPSALLKVEGGISYFIAGEALRQTSEVKSATFGYVSAAFRL